MLAQMLTQSAEMAAHGVPSQTAMWLPLLTKIAGPHMPDVASVIDKISKAPTKAAKIEIMTDFVASTREQSTTPTQAAEVREAVMRCRHCRRYSLVSPQQED